jgi:hypothetical protein
VPNSQLKQNADDFGFHQEYDSHCDKNSDRKNKETDILMLKSTKIPIFPHSTFYSSFSASARNVEDPKEFNPTEISQRMPCRKIGKLTASKSDCR